MIRIPPEAQHGYCTGRGQERFHMQLLSCLILELHNWHCGLNVFNAVVWNFCLVGMHNHAFKLHSSPQSIYIEMIQPLKQYLEMPPVLCEQVPQICGALLSVTAYLSQRLLGSFSVSAGLLSCLSPPGFALLLMYSCPAAYGQPAYLWQARSVHCLDRFSSLWEMAGRQEHPMSWIPGLAVCQTMLKYRQQYLVGSLMQTKRRSGWDACFVWGLHGYFLATNGGRRLASSSVPVFSECSVRSHFFQMSTCLFFSPSSIIC